MTVNEFLSRLDGVKGGHGQWTAKCPAHDDQRQSLSVSIGERGRVLLKCHAGCPTEDICAALGLTVKDLFTEDRTKERPQIVDTYPYRNGGQKLRYSDKHFSWRRPDGHGGWIWNRKGLKHQLFVAGELSGTVFLAEGEKDCLNLNRLGYNAASGEDGAGPGKWRKEYTAELSGLSVVIFQDNDDVGKAYAQEIAAALHGVAASVRVVDLSCIWSEIPEHGDISDLIDRFGDEKVRELIAQLVQSTPEWAPGMDIRPADYSDAANADVFAAVHANDLIYTDALGWLWWNGKRWERDDHKPMSWAMELSGAMLKEASAEHRAALLTQAEAKARYAESGSDEDSKAKKLADVEVNKAEAYLKHAKASRNAMRLKNMLELAKPALVVKADTLDANPLDLNTPIGIINLSTGKLRPHDPKAYCSQITAASPGTAGAEQWINFLDTITQHDGSIQGFLQLVAGMALFGAVYYEGVIIAYGGGRNGKSTFFNSLGATVGDYAGSIAVKLLTMDKNNQGASLATLRGKRLVITGELEEHQRLSVAMLKQLASTDRLVIEEKYHQPETVTPSHSLVLFTNHLPRVGSVDNGTWRRLTVVPFNATIPPSESVANYGDVLAKEAGPAILAWAIQGAVNFARNGYKLDIPEAVEEITDAYRAREDWLSNFINERCIKDPNARVRTGELYSAYREWAESVGDYVRRGNDFTAAMEATGYHYTTSKGYKYWHGLRVDVAETYRSRYAATV